MTTKPFVCSLCRARCSFLVLHASSFVCEDCEDLLINSGPPSAELVSAEKGIACFTDSDLPPHLDSLPSTTPHL